MDNVWNTVPLGDYELHMQHESVGQSVLLNNLAKKYLEKHRPEIVMFLGITGGNGLEHIDNNVTRQVFGIDINQNYLDETEKRYRDRISNLNLLQLDISSGITANITRAHLIWAALIFEYVEPATCFEFISNNIRENAYLVVTIQDNKGVSSVSPTGIETIKPVGQLFKPVPESNLVSIANKYGFHKIDYEENILPNKKSLKTFTFVKNSEPGIGRHSNSNF